MNCRTNYMIIACVKPHKRWRVYKTFGMPGTACWGVSVPLHLLLLQPLQTLFDVVQFERTCSLATRPAGRHELPCRQITLTRRLQQTATAFGRSPTV